MALLDDARAAQLAELARQLFLWLDQNPLPELDTVAIDPARSRMHAGIYRKLVRAPGLGRGTIVRFWDDPDDERWLRTHRCGVDYVLLVSDPHAERWDLQRFYEENEVYPVPGVPLDRPGAIAINDPVLDSREARVDVLAQVVHHTFAGLVNRSDLVWDDAAEAVRCHVRGEYRWIFDYEVPRPDYQRNVNEILPINAGDDVVELRRYLYHSSTYAERTRVMTTGGDYYNKWRTNPSKGGADREFRPIRLTREYLLESWHEYVLQRDESYLLVKVPGVHMVYRLRLQPAKPGAAAGSALEVRPVLRFFNRHQARAGDLPAKPVAAELVIFHAIDGQRDLPAQMPSRGAMELSGDSSGRHAYDYKAALRWLLGDQDVLHPERDEDWFRLFHETLFGDPVYPIDGALAYVEECTFSAAEVLALADDTSGELRRVLDDHRAAATGSNLRYVMKGWIYGPSRATRRQLIGVSEAGFVYEWFPETGRVTRMPVGQWLYHGHVERLAAGIYERTKHIIPYAMVVTWGGVAVAGGAVVGGAVLSHAARTVIRTFAANVALKKLTREVVRRFRTQIIAILVDGVMSLLPRTQSVGLEFLRGFMHGFGAGAVEHWLNRVDDRFEKALKRVYRTAINKVTKGVDRVYQVYLKLNAAYTRLLALFKALRKVWTDERARELARMLNLLGTRVGLAFLLLVFVVVYADYLSRAKIDKDTRALVAKQQRDLFRYMITETGAEIATYAEAMREDLANPTPSAALVRERNERMALSLARAAAQAPTKAPSVVAFLREMLAEIGIEQWDELQRLGLFDLLALGFDAAQAKHPGLVADEARALGEAVGELVGTIFLERAIMPARLKKSARSPLSRDFVLYEKVLGDGTARAFLRFVTHPITRLREEVERVQRGLARTDAESDDVFEQQARTSTAYRDLADEVAARAAEQGQSMRALVAAPGFVERLSDVVARAASEELPLMDELKSDAPTGWPREILLFIIQVWSRAALHQALRAFELVEDARPFDGAFSLASLLEVLGLNVALDDHTIQNLRVEFERS